MLVRSAPIANCQDGDGTEQPGAASEGSLEAGSLLSNPPCKLARPSGKQHTVLITMPGEGRSQNGRHALARWLCQSDAVNDQLHACVRRLSRNPPAS